MAKKAFKAESKRLLDLMINSIYTHKEIFLRELISNASDACDKLYYRSLNEDATGIAREDFAIRVTVDVSARLLTVEDNGIGMTREEVEQNLGTIARSGSLAFKNENEQGEDIDIIGQFGVGFYSAFMVADCVTVITRKFGEEQAWCWQSKGADGYTVTESEMDGHGTRILMHLKPDTEDDRFSEYLDEYRLRDLIRKYSDYIRYPIVMLEEVEDEEEGAEPTFTEVTVNSMVPLWKKNKSEITPEEYSAFYKDKFHDFEDPLRTVYTSTEGAATYNALLFIPARAPYNYYSRDFEKGLQLYASGVLIMDRCPDLLPDCFSFVRGLVDSQDLSLNISREMLQHDRQLRIIAGRIEKKIASELTAMLGNDREKYEQFFKIFGAQLKFGVYQEFMSKKELLQDLLLFVSSAEKKYVTLREYVDRMPEGQKYIYYACGETADRIERMPQCEAVREKGYEILYFTEDVDEFAVRMMMTYADLEFRSVSAADIGLDAEEQSEQPQEQTDLFGFMTGALAGKVKAVRASQRLKSHAVCLSSDGDLSLDMERVLNNLPGEQKVQAERVLEINCEHPVYARLLLLYSEDQEKLAMYTELLYDQALLMEGLSLADPVAFADRVSRLMAEE